MLLKKEYYLLPMRDMVLFPGSTTVLFIGRAKSMLTVEKAYLDNEKIFCITQKDKNIENITNINDLYEVGTLCEITQKSITPSGDIKLFVKGIEKYRLDKINEKEMTLYRKLAKSS